MKSALFLIIMSLIASYVGYGQSLTNDQKIRNGRVGAATNPNPVRQVLQQASF